MSTTNNQEKTSEKFGLERLNALSDGVVAIAITLLVLGIEIPADHDFDSQGLKSFLIKLEPGVIAYITSFIVIALYWMLHHRIYNFAKHSNNNLIRLNMLFLFSISIIPFVSKVKSLYRIEEIAVVLFGSAHILTGIVLFATWKYLIANPDMQRITISKKRDQFFSLKIMMIPVISLLAIFIAFINIHIGTYLFLLIPLIFTFMNSVVKPFLLKE